MENDTDTPAYTQFYKFLVLLGNMAINVSSLEMLQDTSSISQATKPVALSIPSLYIGV